MRSGLYLSSAEAVGRIFKLDIHQHYPAVANLAVHRKNGQSVNFSPEEAVQQAAAYSILQALQRRYFFLQRPVLFSYPRQNMSSPCISPRASSCSLYRACILLFCDLLSCVLLSSDRYPIPLILTSQCVSSTCLVSPALRYLSRPLMQCPPFPYHHSRTPTCPNVPFYHILLHCVLLAFNYPCYPLQAGNILSTPSPTPAPTPVKIADSDLLKLLIIVDSTSRGIRVWMPW